MRGYGCICGLSGDSWPKRTRTFFDVPWHGAMYFVLDVIPIKGKAEVACSIPVCVNFVVLLENTHEMLNIVLVDVFHSKVINNEVETDGAPVVLPIAWGDFLWQYPAFWSCLVSRSCAMIPAWGRPYMPHCTSQKTLPSVSTLSRSPYSSMMSGGNNSNFIQKYSKLSICVIPPVCGLV